MITHDISKAIFTLPNFKCSLSDIALTKPSPELSTTFAMTERVTPNATVIIPTTVNINLTV